LYFFLLPFLKLQHFTKLKEAFEQTGVCDPHNFVPTNPIKTHEGTFDLVCCPVCKLAQLNYKGTTYEDTLNRVVGWVTYNGFIAEKTNQEKEAMFANLGKVETKSVPFDSIFQVQEKEEFDFFGENQVKSDVEKLKAYGKVLEF